MIHRCQRKQWRTGILNTADNISSQLKEISTKAQFITIAIDESMGVRGIAQVAVFFMFAIII